MVTPRLVENGRKVHERHIVCVFGQRKHYADVRNIDDNAFFSLRYAIFC